MLVSLNIDNYAIIRSAKVDFLDGFSSICGETGAGKSIIIGALSLVLGGRADTSVLFDKDRKCIVEAAFSVNERFKEYFEREDLDYKSMSIFRREITPLGKSRAFINDTPVNLSTMKSLSDLLVDIHSQSSTIDLKNHAFQMNIVDSLLEDKTPLDDYHTLYKEYQRLSTSLQEKENLQSNFVKEKSYNEFLFNELLNANLQIGEQEEKEEQLDLISNQEQIKENVLASLNMFENENSVSILSLMDEVKGLIGKISSHNVHLKEIYDRIVSSDIEIKDIFGELSSFNGDVDFSAMDLQSLNDRLNLIYSLEKKHNVSSIAELVEIQRSLQEKLQQNDDIVFEIDNLKHKIAEIIQKMDELSVRINSLRQHSAKLLEKSIHPLLSSMAMKDAVLKVEIEREKDFTPNGKDRVSFFFNANKTKDNLLQDIGKVISGGELSRLMLAIKAVISDKFSVPTMIFDEIDTGISGDIASKAADIMIKIGKNHQVISITHLVQMAAKSKHQYRVYKETNGSLTESHISLLNNDERVEEIAKMLSGDKVTEASILNAKSLLNLS